jgi:hypothetical protein
VEEGEGLHAVWRGRKAEEEEEEELRVSIEVLGIEVSGGDAHSRILSLLSEWSEGQLDLPARV